MIAEWLKVAATMPGMHSQRDLAAAAGINEDQMSKVVRGKRRLTSVELLRISEKTGLPPPNNASSPLNRRPVTYVKVIGDVAEGVWREVAFHDFQEYETAYTQDPRWPEGSVFALVVRGKSMLRHAQEGDLALVLKAEAAPRAFEDGDVVLVERYRDGLIERTVKKVKASTQGWELCPDTSEPAHQRAILFDKDVRVAGFVLELMKPITRFA